MRKVTSTTGFNVILNEAIAGGLPRLDGRPGCTIMVRPGLNVIPDEVVDHWFVRMHIADGLAALLPDQPPHTVPAYQPIEPPPAPIGAEPAIQA